jgi:hypothetical protein
VGSGDESYATAAAAYLRRRRVLLARLARVEAALRPGPAAASGVPRGLLAALHRLLTDELARLDGRRPGG